MTRRVQGFDPKIFSTVSPVSFHFSKLHTKMWSTLWVVAVEWPASLVTQVLQGSSMVGKLSCGLAHLSVTGMVFEVYY